MTEHSIPVDLLNPGQVFACLGFLEAADVLCGNAEGGFDWRDETDTRFHLRASGDDSPVETVLRFLAEAKVTAIAPYGSENQKEKWKKGWEEKCKLTLLKQGDPFPYPNPSSPATLPARLEANGKAILLDYWGDATIRDNAKFWAGSGGYPGAALTLDALELIRDRIKEAGDNPFALSALQSSSFRFDWRRDYISLDVGFSPNDHKEDIHMVGYPLVELLAAIGLSHARPQRQKKLSYRYGIVAGNRNDDFLLAPIFLRAALGCAELPFSQRFFHMELGWPGQKNQARCILDVKEEINL